MVTGFDYLSKDSVLIEHWVRRVVAIVVDSILIFAPLALLFGIIGLSWLFPWWWAGAVLFLYSALFEATVGGTIGKILLHLKAVSVQGKMNSSQALMRNIAKVFPPFLLLDWIIGMAVDTNDPRQKWTDQLARTSVIVYDRPGGT